MGNRDSDWLVKLNITYLLWVENPICSPGSQAWPTQFYLYYRKWRKGVRWMNHRVVLFTSLYMYIFVERLVMFIVYALWSVSEHDIPSFDYIMKCISWWNALINIILSCFVLGTNSATLSNQKDLLWNYLKA